jgi:alkane 1-monooxygenase
LWFGLVPIADWLIGPLSAWWKGRPAVAARRLRRDLNVRAARNNRPKTAVRQLERDPFYRYLTYCTVPIHYGTFLACVWYVGTHQLDWFGLIGLTLALGLVNGTAINVGHELGHKNSVLEHWLAKAVLALVGYGHFYNEHNKGHHRHVATPEDPASARFGESIYQFARRETSGAWRRAWERERSRLTRKGKNPWSWENQVLQPLGLTLLLYGILVAVFGVIMVPFLIAQAAIGWLQSTLANYIEHYGLLRLKMPDGSYERCRPEHSWNSNHLISNFVMLHLQRHSDHHANPMRRYQSLRNSKGNPQLPAGYPAMYLLALVPPLWRRIMDPVLLKEVKGDMSRVNIGPRHEESGSVAGEGSGRWLPRQA